MRAAVNAITLFSLFTISIGCASSGSGNAASRTSPDRITRSEIATSQATNAYELVTRLRPNWLRPPATATIGGGVIRSQAILVYLDRQRLQDVAALKGISIESLDSAQWIDAGRVATVLNDVPSGPIAGAIVLKSR